MQAALQFCKYSIQFRSRLHGWHTDLARAASKTFLVNDINSIFLAAPSPAANRLRICVLEKTNGHNKRKTIRNLYTHEATTKFVGYRLNLVLYQAYFIIFQQVIIVILIRLHSH